jgi:hypothetical protein
VRGASVEGAVQAEARADAPGREGHHCAKGVLGPGSSRAVRAAQRSRWRTPPGWDSAEQARPRRRSLRGRAQHRRPSSDPCRGVPHRRRWSRTILRSSAFPRPGSGRAVLSRVERGRRIAREPD